MNEANEDKKIRQDGLGIDQIYHDYDINAVLR